MGSGGNAAGSGATQAGAVACTYGPQFIEASRPERRASRGPSTGSGAPALPVQHEEIVTESNRPSSENCGARSREAVSVHTESLVYVVAAETCLRRRNARLPGIICRRLQITAVRRCDPGELSSVVDAHIWLFC